MLPNTCNANDDNEYFLRQGKEYGYKFRPPSNFSRTNKPLQTHLDEVNFEPSPEEEGIPKGYLYGITVDPVRINSLTQFGTPQEVAARVVTAELNRDGVLQVTLLDEALSYTDNNNHVYYAIDYLSDGKRGLKRFVTRTCIADQKLYVLTAQIKEADYQGDAIRRREIEDALNSFVVLGGATS